MCEEIRIKDGPWIDTVGEAKKFFGADNLVFDPETADRKTPPQDDECLSAKPCPRLRQGRCRKALCF